jgi:DNA-binding transcriptional LysR family regulator
MELLDLHVFRTVAREGGITRAAERLHRVQSNVTVRVKKLEEDLGVALFLREGKRMQLSPHGRILLGYADRLLDLAQEARNALHQSRPHGRLRVGTMESAAAARLPEPLRVFTERFPEVKLELSIMQIDEMVQKVLSGDLDAALAAEPIADPRLETMPVFEEELVLMAGAGHRRIRNPEDVEKGTLLAFHPGCPNRLRLEAWYADHEVLPDRVIEIESYHAMLGCAVAGMGVALLPRSVLDGFSGRSALSVHPISPKFRKLRTLYIWRKDAPQANIDALAEVLTEVPGARAATTAPRRPD